MKQVEAVEDVAERRAQNPDVSQHSVPCPCPDCQPPPHWLPFETVEEAEAAGYKSGTLANGDTFGDEDDGESDDYESSEV